MTWVLIILMGGGLSSGSVFKVGSYNQETSCEIVRKKLVDDQKTPLRSSHVLCVPVDKEIP